MLDRNNKIVQASWMTKSSSYRRTPDLPVCSLYGQKDPDTRTGNADQTLYY